MGFFGSKKTKTKPLWWPGQFSAISGLLETSLPGAKERLSLAGTPYRGDLSAPMTDIEKSGLDTLEGWMGSDLPSQDPLFGLGRQEYERTLGGDYYDPAQSQYWLAYNTALDRALQEARDRLAARTSARDAFYSGGRVAGEAELEEEAMNQRALVLAELMERERERRLGAIPGMLDFLGKEELYPLGRVAASQEYGGLEREIEQASLDRQYNEYIRQMTDLGIPLETAMMLATYKPDWTTKTSGGEFWDLLNPIASLGGASGNITPTGGGGFPGLASLGGGIYNALFGNPLSANLAEGTGMLGGLGNAAGGLANLFGSGIGALFSLISDVRFKENIEPIENSLDKLKQLRGNTYNFIQTPDRRDGGLIAQELEKILPEAVFEVKGVKFVQFNAVLGLLVNAVNELAEKVGA